MSPRRNKNDSNKKKGSSKHKKEDDVNEDVFSSLDMNDLVGSHDKEEEEEKREETAPNEEQAIDEGGHAWIDQGEERMFRKAAYKTEAEIRRDLASQKLSRKDSIKRERMRHRQLQGQAVTGETTVTSTYSSSSEQSLTPSQNLSTLSSSTSSGRLRRGAVKAVILEQGVPVPGPPSTSREFRPATISPRRPPPEPSQLASHKDQTEEKKDSNNISKTKSLQDSTATMETAYDMTEDSDTMERLDEEVAMAVAHARPRWPLLQWANPFPHRRAQHSTTRRAKQAKSQRQSMRHGSTLGVLSEEDGATDDETDETRETTSRGDDSIHNPNIRHGWLCLCWTTRFCMWTLGCLLCIVVVGLVLGLVFYFVVDREGGSKKAPVAETGKPVVRGSSTPTGAPVVGSGKPVASTLAPVVPGMSRPPTDPPTPAPNMSIAASLQGVLPDYTLKAIQDASSPQYKAYIWLINHPYINLMPDWKKQQLMALVTFYYSFQGYDWPEEKRANFLSYDVDECDWGQQTTCTDEYFGNGCHEEDGKYKDLNLDWFLGPSCTIGGFSPSITGSKMPPELALLTRLENLGIRNAGLDATLEDLIPTQLTDSLTNLQRLNFKMNNIGGTIPARISKLTNLQRFSVGSNYLTGTIPSQLSSLRKLQQFELFANDLTGTIPNSFGQLTSIVTFSAISNRLSGTIPEGIAAWTSLESLYMDTNDLVGTIPAGICRLANITSILVDCSVTCPSDCGACQCYQ